jgi:zinc transporter ZupT
MSQSNEEGCSEHAHDNDNEGSVDLLGCPCHAEDPVASLEKVQQMAEKIDTHEKTEHKDWGGEPTTDRATEDPVAAVLDGQDAPASDNGFDADSNDKDHETKEDEEVEETDDQRKLVRMSINTVAAIALHNFPEGLATFVAALDDPAVGGVLAIAIALHNIPEGLCVAMPVYYATGKKWQAFGWACLSGLSEPFAAILGYVILASVFSPTVYAILFGVVAGMMVIISVRELLPTAHRYDPEDSVVTNCFIGGMLLMAVSLALFKF